MGRTVWSRREMDAVTTAFVLASLALAGIHLYLGVLAADGPTTPARQFLLIAVTFLVLVPLYFTRYWRPVLYPFVALYALFLGVLWLLGGMQYRTVGTVTGVVASAFVVLALYLYYREAPSTLGS